MRKIAIFSLFYFLCINTMAYADFKKEMEFKKSKDCKNFFLENARTKKENNEQYKNNEKLKRVFQAYVLSREADGHKDCSNNIKLSLQLRFEALKLLEGIKRPDLDILQQLATAYQMVGYDYNRLGDIKNGIGYLEKGLKIEEENFYEKNFENISVTYNVLGFWYTDIYQYKKGEDYQRKYLDYVKKSKGENSLEYYDSYFGLASDYIKAGKYDYSVKTFLELEKKLSNFKLTIIEKILFYRNVSLSYYWLQDFGLQKKYLLVAFDLLNNNKNNIDNEKFIRYEILLNNDLGLNYTYVFSVSGNTQNLQTAEKYFLKSIELSNFLKKDDELHINFGNLAGVYSSLGNYKKAIEFHSKSLKLCQSTLSEFHIECLKQMSSLGHAYYKNNNYDKALNLYLIVLDKEPRDFGSFQENRISNRNLVALLYQNKGNYELAEKYLLEGISLWNPEKPQNHLAYYDTLNSLYNLYFSTGRYEESGKGYQELLAIIKKKYGPESPQLTVVYNGLSLYYGTKGMIDKSIEAIKQAILITEKSNPNDPLRATLYHNLGHAYSSLGDSKLAEKNYEISLKLRASEKGYDTVLTLIELAKNKIYLKKYEEAKNLLDDSISVIEEKLGKNHPVKAYAFQRYAELYFLTKNLEKYTENLALSHQFISAHASGIYSSKFTIKKNYFVEPINLFFDSLNLLNDKQYSFLLENFSHYSNTLFKDTIIELSEISRTTTINESVKNLIERNKDPKVASVKKEYQNLLISYEKAKKFSDIDSEKKIIFNNLANLKNQIFEKRKVLLNLLELNGKQIVGNQVSLERIQKQIKNDEVLIAYYFTSNNLHVAIIDSNETRFETINTNNKKINTIIKNIRASLEIGNDKKIKDFSVLQSKILYNEILDPVIKKIKNKNNLIIIPHKSLLSMPFELLIDEEGVHKNNDYKNINWLVNKFSISYYPSINSFYSLRTIAQAKSSKDFAGFGDPKFIKTTVASSDIKFNNFFLRNGIANKKELLKFEELPETKDELTYLSKVFQNGSDLYLGKDFTESKVKSLKLDQYKVISFATHAVLANEVNNIAEPGIILTPPDEPNEIDDGVLTVSEIQKLKLAADTVILSACNTAGKDGSADADGLSGLASAFFHAGAKSLMVTHWSVETNSAVKIMTDTFKNFDKNISLSQSLTLAKREMIKNESTAHPMFWAPFVIVGDNPKKL